ncbi:MAG: ketopantoate reductase [Bacteroidota bacterium]|nr:ketopantoate reductase [Bacteroidota bacterium]
MKILFFGRGAIATQYGWALEQAGNDITFYVRPGRVAEYGRTISLNMFDARKKIKGVLICENWAIKMIEYLPENHDYDLIILSVQHYHVKSAVDFLTDKIGKATLLVFSTFWTEPQAALAQIPESQLVWGFPQATGGFDEKGVMNASLFGKINIGTFGTAQTQRGVAVINMFKLSEFTVKEFTDFRSYLFTHFVVNAAMHLENLQWGDGLAPIAALKTTRYWRNIIANGKELLPLLKARKVDMRVNSEIKLFSSPPFVLGLAMRVAIPLLPSLKQSLTCHSNPAELKSYCQDVVKTADELRIELPRYKANKDVYK